MKLGFSLGIDRVGNSAPAFSSSVTYISGGSGNFAGSTFVFSPVNTQIGDWVFAVADGVYATTITGGSGVTWTRLSQFNNAGIWTTIFYRQLVSGDIGASFTINNGSNAGPAEWVVYRGVTSVPAPQGRITTANASNIVFNAPTLSANSGRLLAIISEHGSAGAGSWSAPVNWTTRIAVASFGPKYLGDIQSSVYSSGGGGQITFTTSVTQVEGQVGWLFELIGA